MGSNVCVYPVNSIDTFKVASMLILSVSAEMGTLRTMSPIWGLILYVGNNLLGLNKSHGYSKLISGPNLVFRFNPIF